MNLAFVSTLHLAGLLIPGIPISFQALELQAGCCGHPAFTWALRPQMLALMLAASVESLLALKPSTQPLLFNPGLSHDDFVL